jgi:FKBP-type peptidyl-prolyl cis-trans isomerase
MARKRERIFAGFFAGLFLVTSSALTVAVILTLVQGDKNNKNQSQETKVDNSKKLTGTQMADFTPTSQPLAALQQVDTKPGTGEQVKPGDTVTADYVGAVMSNGTIFDAAADHGGPQTFSLSQVIAGWSQGIPGMKVGGTRRLYIPAALAYGPNPPSGTNIPVNADLVFDVTVTKIDK